MIDYIPAYTISYVIIVDETSIHVYCRSYPFDLTDCTATDVTFRREYWSILSIFLYFRWAKVDSLTDLVELAVAVAVAISSGVVDGPDAPWDLSAQLESSTSSRNEHSV